MLLRVPVPAVLLLSACAGAPERGVPAVRAARFEGSPAERAAYLACYRAGYEAALTAHLGSWCFRGPLEHARSAGWSDGQGDGLLVWFEEMDTAVALRDRPRVLALLCAHGDDAVRIADALLAGAP